jgi:VIT1/CCC1 family predicted Fe2+/Mn2+ transporter
MNLDQNKAIISVVVAIVAQFILTFVIGLIVGILGFGAAAATGTFNQ